MKLAQLALPLFFLSHASAIMPPPPPMEDEEDMYKNVSIEDNSPSPGLNTAFENISLTPAAHNYVPQPPPEETESAWESHFSTGYVSNYDYNGMVASNRLCREGALTLELASKYALSNGMFLSGEWDYNEIFCGELRKKDQHHFTLNLEDELFPNLHINYGYSFYHGGIPGVYAKNKGEAHSLTQQFDVSVRYNFKPEGYFVGLNASYAFQGITGWWLGAFAGYEHEITENLHAVLTTSLSSSWSYWDADGMNQVSCELELPYQFSENWTLSPFTALHWLGRSGLKMNSYAGERIMRPYTLTAGVRVYFSF